ncbi:MAG: damage-inducible protein DinB [Treponema sp.]|jgi:uncharacterized damage-inducible protein DinB|nr:damage-inducible protein DinB [Treponema sp.]
MKDIFIAFAKQNQDSDKAVLSLLDALDNAEREKNRKSYYKSLSGLARHIMGGTLFFLDLMGKAVPKNAGAQKAIADAAKIPCFGEKKLDEDGWKSFVTSIKKADKNLTAFVEALLDADFSAPVAVPFYKGKPKTVPLFFMLQNLAAHNIHHRGQISQILDSLGIPNDYSALSPSFLHA